MSSSVPCLVVLDFPGIKKYVFGTDRLVEIRGASALLDRLNRHVIPQWVLETFGATHSRVVFAGGGTGQFIIDAASETIREKLHDVEGEIYRQSGGALGMVVGVAALDGDYPSALRRAFLDLETQKFQNPVVHHAPCHTGFIRECDSCSGMASEVSEFAGESRLLCTSCALKEKMGKERGLWEEFAAYLKTHGTDADRSWRWRPRDFEKIGDRCRSRRGYTAVLYGDGNSMGRIVKQIRTEEQFKRFSRAVDIAIREACHEALWRHCRPVNGKMPVDILLLGGDDLIVYLAADCAMPVAVDVARLFEAKTREYLLSGDDNSFFSTRLDGKGLTLSIGIAYGRTHTPISIMVNQAEELLKSAKTKGAVQEGEGAYTPACIDFHLTSRFNQASAIDSRRQHLTLRAHRKEEVRLYRGPYTVEEAEALVQHARSLKQSGIPRSRLHRLSEAPFKGTVNGTIETLSIYGRCRTAEQKQAIWHALDRFGCLFEMPWNRDGTEISTALVDLTEIAEFVLTTEEGANYGSPHQA